MIFKRDKKKSLKSTIISYSVSFIAIALCFYIAIAVIIANLRNEPPSVFSLSVSYVPTESMEPTIKSKTYVLYHKVSYKSVKTGDIIIYYNSDEDKYIIHRVVAKVENKNIVSIYDDTLIDSCNYLITNQEENNFLITKGDNNALIDTVITTSNNLYGKYNFTINFMSIFSAGINKNLVFLFIAIVFILMISLQLVEMVLKGKKEEIEKQKQQQEKERLEKLKEELLLEIKKEQEEQNEEPK